MESITLIENSPTRDWLDTPTGPAIFLPTPPRKPIARTQRSYRSVTLTPDFWPSSGIVSINDFGGFVFGFFMPPHFLPLPVIPEVSRSSTGSLQNPSPVCEHWHLASALTVSFPVHRGRSAAEPVGRSSFLPAVPVP